jgi:predicted SAM-dependent methyltransferase
VKLNIGAGDTQIDGFTPIDRKFGQEAYPLQYADNSVDEIRASHILEHFTFREASEALREWVRVLKPGGKIRIAVPDVDKCLTSSDPNRLFYLMGGQTDENDIHKSAYDLNRLRAVMQDAGIGNVRRWESHNTDTAAHPVSLNLEGEKLGQPTTEKELDVKVIAYMTLPRYEAVVARSIIEGSLKQLGIPLATSQGVFWGQCMQRMFEDAVSQNVDWILTVDSDSLFNADHVSQLMTEFGSNSHIDALAALQCRRGKPFPLATKGGADGITVSNKNPFLVTTAHFGLTLIRVEDLLQIKKPWFYGQPDKNGEWGDDRLDDDIWFWHQWRLAGKNIYVAPRVSIGHLEEMVAGFDENLQPKHEYVHEWRKNNLQLRGSNS